MAREDTIEHRNWVGEDNGEDEKEEVGSVNNNKSVGVEDERRIGWKVERRRRRYARCVPFCLKVSLRSWNHHRKAQTDFIRRCFTMARVQSTSSLPRCVGMGGAMKDRERRSLTTFIVTPTLISAAASDHIHVEWTDICLF